VEISNKCCNITKNMFALEMLKNS